jgi:hypothetical protein
MAPSTGFQPSWSASSTNAYSSSLSSRLQHIKSLKRQISDTIADVASVLLYKEEWLELIPWILSQISSPVPHWTQQQLHAQVQQQLVQYTEQLQHLPQQQQYLLVQQQQMDLLYDEQVNAVATKMSCLNILNKLIETTSDSLTDHIQSIVQCYTFCLTFSSALPSQPSPSSANAFVPDSSYLPNMDLQMHALAATGLFYCVSNVIEPAGIDKTLIQLVPQLLNVIGLILSGKYPGATQSHSQNEVLAINILKSMEQITNSNDAKFFKPQLDIIGVAMLAMGQAATFSDGLRQLCLEIMVGIVEQASAICRKNKKFLDSVVTLCFNLMLTVQDDEEHSYTKQPESDDADGMLIC